MSAAAPHAASLALLAGEVRLSPVAQIALKVAVAVTVWSQRARTRKALAQLDDHILRDIGLDRRQAFTESRRMFWQG